MGKQWEMSGRQDEGRKACVPYLVTGFQFLPLQEPFHYNSLVGEFTLKGCRFTSRHSNIFKWSHQADDTCLKKIRNHLQIDRYHPLLAAMDHFPKTEREYKQTEVIKLTTPSEGADLWRFSTHRAGGFSKNRSVRKLLCIYVLAKLYLPLAKIRSEPSKIATLFYWLQKEVVSNNAELSY